MTFLLGISKPMVCMRVAFDENDGNRENDEDNSDSHNQEGIVLDERKSRKPQR